MGWLEQHLQTFVAKHLGFVPESEGPHFFTPEELSVIKSWWRSAKACAKGKKILLAGRDVFVFEILARRENYPTLFLPECSRASVKSITLPDGDLFLLDTGFAGSIPAALHVKNFRLLSYAMPQQVEVQVFPRLTMSRHLALRIETIPKYWKTAHLVDGKIHQEFSELRELLMAAMLTMQVYRNSAPRFMDGPKPLSAAL
jgi:hypothetical protein